MADAVRTLLQWKIESVKWTIDGGRCPHPIYMFIQTKTLATLAQIELQAFFLSLFDSKAVRLSRNSSFLISDS